MKLRFLGAALAAMLGCVSANTANATALPAQFRAGQQVMNNAGGDHSQAAIMDFCKREGIPLRPVGTQFIGKTDFCVFAYTAYLTDKAITKTGYSTKDTLSRLSQGWQQFEVYRQQGLGELLQPLFMLALVPEGQQFLVKKGMLRQSDIAGFDSMMAYERKLTEQRNKKPSASCVQSKTAEYSAVAGPLAKQMAEQWCKKYGQ
ncbi:hypothetical protein JGB00_19950 [Salmonella enterica subsp. enterica serovar Derby]|uniref:hypothetical protein n=1 Tax=Escherichia coli TaxID=562 RepID=UPI0018E91385|nr:hypothetical protein [Salmonella enterica subsp. enterica serovar Derby]